MTRARATSTFAAQYLRMSSDEQDLSLDVQRDAIAKYAQDRGLHVAYTFEDQGRSGLTIEARPAMQQLLADVALPACPFSVILVYDVSRWGRFQDTDASAYYEYHCRLNGVNVFYVAEPFAADMSPLTTIIKNLKRAMAAEYIRELKVKIRAAQERAIDRGFQMGTIPSLGIRRVAVSKEGHMRALAPSELKCRQSERIKWVSGPPHEVELVRRIFQLYSQSEIGIRGIARLLASEGARTHDGRPITEMMLNHILDSEAFIGNFTWGKAESGKKRDERHPLFRRGVGTIEPLVDVAVWKRAQTRRGWRAPTRRTSEQLLADLRAALLRNPTLGVMDVRSYGCATSDTYAAAFGSFHAALRLAGADLQQLNAASVRNRRHAMHVANAFTKDLQALLTTSGIHWNTPSRQRLLIFQNRVSVRVQLVWLRRWRDEQRWWLQKRSKPGDFVLLVRLLLDSTAFDFVLLEKSKYHTFPAWSEATLSRCEQIHSGDELIRKLLHLAT